MLNAYSTVCVCYSLKKLLFEMVVFDVYIFFRHGPERQAEATVKNTGMVNGLQKITLNVSGILFGLRKSFNEI